MLNLERVQFYESDMLPNSSYLPVDFVCLFVLFSLERFIFVVFMLEHPYECMRRSSEAREGIGSLEPK